MRSKHSTKQSKMLHGTRLVWMAAALILVCCTVIGGSVAWLMTKTEPIQNVFTYGDINITLKETTGEVYKMTPGKTLTKDPTITVSADSENCWLFVKIEESAVEKLSDYIDYDVAEGWTELDNVPGVYYRAVDSSDTDVSYGVLAGNQVTVKDTVTKAMLEELNDSNYPTLTFTGYAVQRDANIDAIDTAAKAWALVSGS